MQMQTQRIEIEGVSSSPISVNCALLGVSETPSPESAERETLVFLEGWGTSISIYPRLLEHMAHFIPVAAMDYPGFGGTAEPDKPWEVEDFADFVCAFIEKLGLKKVVLMGHSHGGRIAVELASRENLPFTITRMILMDAAGVILPKTAKQKFRQRQYKICRKILELPFCRVLYPDALENLRRSHGSADYLNASPLMRQTLVRCVNTDMTPKMPGIKVPALLIWGEKDTATPIETGETMEKLIPSAALVHVPGAGHFPFVDNWELTARVLASYLNAEE